MGQVYRKCFGSQSEGMFACKTATADACHFCNTDGCNGAAEHGPMAMMIISIPIAISKLISQWADCFIMAFTILSNIIFASICHEFIINDQRFSSGNESKWIKIWHQKWFFLWKWFSWVCLFHGLFKTSFQRCAPSKKNWTFSS